MVQKTHKLRLTRRVCPCLFYLLPNYSTVLNFRWKACLCVTSTFNILLKNDSISVQFCTHHVLKQGMKIVTVSVHRKWDRLVTYWLALVALWCPKHKQIVWLTKWNNWNHIQIEKIEKYKQIQWIYAPPHPWKKKRNGVAFCTSSFSRSNITKKNKKKVPARSAELRTTESRKQCPSAFLQGQGTYSLHTWVVLGLESSIS